MCAMGVIASGALWMGGFDVVSEVAGSGCGEFGGPRFGGIGAPLFEARQRKARSILRGGIM